MHSRQPRHRWNWSSRRNLCPKPSLLRAGCGASLGWKISADEMKGVEAQSIGMLAIAFAILISTIIQATNSVEGQPLTRFHAAVILDLSWMNNTSTWIWFLLYAHRLSKAETRTGCSESLRCPLCRLEPGREPVSATGLVWAPVILGQGDFD
ncbi:hypothetical protein B0H19DRAFT_538750, partial [Mycena capillaripes]